jgi:decaprenyl-phosphate phosphoribosyltransferase
MAALIRSLRPKQWIKNSLVLAAPAAAGVLTQTSVIWKTLVAAAIFCSVSSGSYLINDVFDAEADAVHESKRNRPVASGDVGPTAAWVAGSLLIISPIVPLLFTSLRSTAGVVALYAATSLIYTFWGKHIAVLDVGLVASGFLLRAIAGGVAASVPLSNWFLIVVSFGALFVVTSKRYAEVVNARREAPAQRAVLAIYDIDYLGFGRTMSASVAVLAYCLWAFDRAQHLPGTARPVAAILIEISIAPFVLAFMRYALVAGSGKGEEPEEIFLRDRLLQFFGAAWLVALSLALYWGQAAA